MVDKTAEAIQEELDLVRSRIAYVRLAIREYHESIEIELRSILDVARGEGADQQTINTLQNENLRLKAANDTSDRIRKE